MTTFAKRTAVPVERTRAQLETLLDRHGVTDRAVGTQQGWLVVLFEKDGRRVRFRRLLPTEESIRRLQTRKTRGELKQRVEQAQRAAWRSLLLTLTARFVALSEGVETFEEAFLAHVVMPNGQTVGEWARPQLADAYSTGKMPPLLPDGKD